MDVRVATTGCLQWSSSQPIIPHSHLLCSSRQRCRCDVTLASLFPRHLDMASNLGVHAISATPRLRRSRSYERQGRARTLQRSCGENLDGFYDEEFSLKIHELSLRFQLSDDASVGPSSPKDEELEEDNNSFEEHLSSEPPRDELWSQAEVDPPEWHGRTWSDAAIERKANSAGLPLSLRMIKRRMRWQEGFRDAGESACCSVKKAISSLVFIIRELHSYSLQMREALFATGDIQVILARVQREIHASFVWLFQQVFSHTPTLMVSIMILLANFTVHSMATNIALATPIRPTVEVTSSISSSDDLESSSLKTSFSTSAPPTSGSSTYVGGGGGGKVRPVSSGTEGEGGHFGGPRDVRTILPNGGSLHAPSLSEDSEIVLWNSIVDEARGMQAEERGDFSDPETLSRLVSPISVKVEPDNPSDYYGTALMYQIELGGDPNNSLLLANYAQFLYLVAQEYDRAEEYFKKAVDVEPKDPEACNKYATFLWKARNDYCAAEETFLEAIAAEPSNSFYAANYAHFLWNTGAEDTCFPLLSDDQEA